MGTPAPAGWYPVPGNKLCYWDGEAWTEHVRDLAPGGQMIPAAAPGKPAPSRIRSAVSAAAASLRSDEHDLPEGTLWSAIGKNVGKVTTGRYRLDAMYLNYSKGALRTEWQQIFVATIVDVDVRQSVTQKTRAVYTVVVRLQSGPVFTIDDIPDGPTAQQVINAAAVQARLALEQRSIRIDAQRHDATNTVRQEVKVESSAGHTIQPQTVAGVLVPGPDPSPAPPSPSGDDQAAPTAGGVSSPGPSGTADPMAQLRDLGQLRDAGILTDEEFAAKKAEILNRI